MKLAFLAILMPWPIALLQIVMIHLARKAWKWYWKAFIPAPAVREAEPRAYCFRDASMRLPGCAEKGS
ncbi:hypothetical protein GX411_01410 [Candidatus Fermentibacteria bacterium]|nr:hypothetical protein [Candidatus Fermentibacteria bacterium]